MKSLRFAWKDNKNTYLIGRVMKSILRDDNGELYRLLRGYYEYPKEVSSLMIEHPGKNNPGKIIYYMSFGEDSIRTTGFFALVYWQLLCLYYAEKYGLTPVVKWGQHTCYYEKALEEKTDNAFEYFYEPLSDVPSADAAASENLVRITWSHRYRALHELGLDEKNYEMDEKQLQFLAEMYKKYMHLNQETQEYLEKEVPALLQNKRTIGVHIRGTGFKQGTAGHPIYVEPEIYLEKVKELLASGDYDQVFLATDDLEVLTLFRKEIPNLVYYADVLRAEGDLDTHWIKAARSLHRYKLGKEVIRDVYTLAYCDSLICGRSSVSVGSRYINLALDRQFKECVLVDKGIRNNDSRKRKLVEKQIKQEAMKIQREN